MPVVNRAVSSLQKPVNHHTVLTVHDRKLISLPHCPQGPKLVKQLQEQNLSYYYSSPSGKGDNYDDRMSLFSSLAPREPQSEQQYYWIPGELVLKLGVAEPPPEKGAIRGKEERKDWEAPCCCGGCEEGL